MEQRSKETAISKRDQRKEARSVVKDAIFLIPNFIMLLLRLLKDARVSRTERALLVGAIIYVISPFDLIPDFIPFVGQIDDVYLVSLVILRLMVRTPDDILREHWDGGGDVVSVAHRIAKAARYLLPKRIRGILDDRVDDPSLHSIRLAPKRKTDRGERKRA
jgi:uncharacterized membrane protein YkvA (DUF1232 family)